MKARIKNLQIQYKSLNTAILSIEIDKYPLRYLPDGNKPLTVEIKPYKKPRSSSSNALMWELCEKLSEESARKTYTGRQSTQWVLAIQPRYLRRRLRHWQTVGPAEALDGSQKL